jgi:hypothetical protein
MIGKKKVGRNWGKKEFKVFFRIYGAGLHEIRCIVRNETPVSRLGLAQ